jgi:hypothetical protein
MMTARQKIEELTNAWYGYFLLGAAVRVYDRGLGLFTLAGAALSFALTCAVVWGIGRRLLAKSSLTRFLLVIVTGLFTVLGTFATAKTGWSFFTTWSLTTLVYTGFLASSVYMHARSFRVLTDSSVKSYFA